MSVLRWIKRLFRRRLKPPVFYGECEPFTDGVAHVISVSHDGKSIRVWIDCSEVTPTTEA